MTTPSGSSNARIDIDGVFGGCLGNGGVQVSRSMPAVMSGHTSEVEWNNFCDRVDESFESHEKLRKFNRALWSLTLSLYIIMMIVAFATFFRSSNSSSQGFGGARNFLFFIVAGAILMAGFCISSIYSNSKILEMREAIRRVCEEESKRKPTLSFHYRIDRHTSTHSTTSGNGSHSTVVDTYIEVIVAHSRGDVEAPPAFAPSADFNTLNNTIGGGPKTFTERLDDLDRARLHLTEEEYQQKRSEILASF